MKTTQKSLIVFIILLCICPFYLVRSMEEPSRRATIPAGIYSPGFLANILNSLKTWRLEIPKTSWDYSEMTMAISAFEAAMYKSKTAHEAYDHLQTALTHLDKVIKHRPDLRATTNAIRDRDFIAAAAADYNALWKAEYAPELPKPPAIPVLGRNWSMSDLPQAIEGIEKWRQIVKSAQPEDVVFMDNIKEALESARREPNEWLAYVALKRALFALDAEMARFGMKPWFAQPERQMISDIAEHYKEQAEAGEAEKS